MGEEGADGGGLGFILPLRTVGHVGLAWRLGVHEADEFGVERAAQGTSYTGLQRVLQFGKRRKNLPTKEEFV
jgi:hypothetical protein